MTSLTLRGTRPGAVFRSAPGIGPVVVLAVVVGTPLGLAFMLDGSTYDTWGAFIWAPVLLVLAMPLCRWVATKTGEPEMAGFFFAVAALKIVVGATIRYYMVDAVYGAGDAVSYDTYGGLLATPFRQGNFEDLGEITGTRLIEIVNGAVQAVIGQTMVGSFMAFSAFGFVGLCLLYLAFCDAMPTGDHTLYRRLLFLTPTLWFWPSSVGKEAFLLLCLGGIAYGYVKLLNGQLLGMVPAGLGLWAAAVVRPHVALMVMAGAIVALPPALRSGSAGSERNRGRPMRRWAVPVLVLLALPPMLKAAEDFFQIDHLDIESASDVREDVVRRTSAGGSYFEPPDTGGPVGLAEGVATVMVRPLPWEGSGFQRVAAAESVVLLVISIVAIKRRGLRLVRALWERWPRFAITYVLAFAWGFSAVANFGILARQRTLMLPFAFVLVAACTRRASSDESLIEPDGPASVRGPRTDLRPLTS